MWHFHVRSKLNYTDIAVISSVTAERIRSEHHRENNVRYELMETREFKRIHANAKTETNQICKVEKVYFLEKRKILLKYSKRTILINLKI